MTNNESVFISQTNGGIPVSPPAYTLTTSSAISHVKNTFALKYLDYEVEIGDLCTQIDANLHEQESSKLNVVWYRSNTLEQPPTSM